jgi:hypothetical protein
MPVGSRKELDMTRKQNQTGRLGALALVLTLGLGAGMAHGADGWRHGSRGGHSVGHQHNDRCGCEVARTAGYITINGCQTKISSDRGMLAQITRAFRNAGYNAWIQDNCVHVDYGCDKPSVRWHADSYSVRVKWGWDSLGLSLRERNVRVAQPRRVVRPVRRVYSRNTCGW